MDFMSFGGTGKYVMVSVWSLSYRHYQRLTTFGRLKRGRVSAGFRIIGAEQLLQYYVWMLYPIYTRGGCTGRSRRQPGAVNVQGLPLFLRKDIAGYEPRNRIRK